MRNDREIQDDQLQNTAFHKDWYLYLDLILWGNITIAYICYLFTKIQTMQASLINY